MCRCGYWTRAKHDGFDLIMELVGSINGECKWLVSDDRGEY